MSLPRRHLLLALPVVALAACGFQPVYGPGGAGSALRNQVEVAAPEDRFSYTLVRELETRLGRTGDPGYTLSLAVTTSEEGLAIDAADNTTRYNLIGAADFVLRDRRTEQIVTSGRVENFTGYSATGSTVATLAAERDAQIRLMTLLADQITTHLYATKIDG